MQSAGLRRRELESVAAGGRGGSSAAAAPTEVGGPANYPPYHVRNENRRQARKVEAGRPGYKPPHFTVDLSLPPSQRYVHIAPHFKDDIEDLSRLFDDIVKAFFPEFLSGSLHLLARLALRRVCSAEENAELKGIAAATGAKMHLLVAFNVLLDLLLGCTSGGVKVDEPHNPPSDTSAAPGWPMSPAALEQLPWTERILHFRTLDWGMDPLRRVVIELDFVYNAGGPVIATSLTYFGYVGVLTGVRKGLSMSLNFRPHHDGSTWKKRLGFRLHQLLVVLGQRHSISSVLRAYLLAPEEALDGVDSLSTNRTSSEEDAIINTQARIAQEDLPTRVINKILATLSSSPSTSAYLIFCTPTNVYSVEKDNRAVVVHQSETFLTTCNHDIVDEADPSQLKATAREMAVDGAIGMEDLIGYSVDRKRLLTKYWQARVRRHRKSTGRESGAVEYSDVLDMVRHEEISNDETHYAVVMDPSVGKVMWRKVYPPE